jgi:hypothetical protein
MLLIIFLVEAPYLENISQYFMPPFMKKPFDDKKDKKQSKKGLI